MNGTLSLKKFLPTGRILPLRLRDRGLLVRIATASVLGIAYYVAARVGLWMAFVHVSASPVWPPTGIAIASLIVFGYWAWPAVFLGAFFANFVTLGSGIASLGIAIGNTLEALLGAYLVIRFAQGRRALNEPGNVFRFIVLAGIVSTFVSAAIGMTSLFLTGYALLAELNYIFLTWWTGNVGGALIFAPLILAWRKLDRFDFEYDLSPIQLTEIFFLFLLILVASEATFGEILPEALQSYQYTFFVIPPLVWVAFRFSKRGVTAALFVLMLIAVTGTLRGSGPFVLRTPNESLLLLQFFLNTVAVMTLMLSAVVRERQRAKETVAMSERRFRALVEKSSDAVMLVDSHSHIRYVGPSAERMLSYTAEELIGTDGFALLHPGDKEKAMATLAELARKPGDHAQLEVRVRRKDGAEVWVEAIGTNLLTDPAVNAVVVNFRDVSERKELERTKNEFVSTLSYRLRAPLAAVGSYAASLLKSSPKGLLERKYVEEISHANTKMAMLIDDLLRVARIDLGTFPLEPRPTDVRKVMEQALHELLSKIDRKHITMQKEFNLPRGLVMVDPNFLSMVLHILVVYAIDRTPDQGTITVHAARGGDRIVVQVSDTGPVIPAEEQAQLFTKFPGPVNGAEGGERGGGLGLYIVKSLVDLAGGSVAVDSGEGKPTMLIVTFPCKNVVRPPRTNSAGGHGEFSLRP